MSINVDEVSFAAGDTVIVNGVSLTVKRGKVLGLLGPNGSGKSSLLRLICRLRKVRSGVIRLGEDDISSLSRAALARRVAFVEQQSTTDTQLTVRDVVRLGRTPHRGLLSSWGAEDDAAVDQALSRTGMRERAGQLWQTLSGGERQRVHIARSLAQAPSELLLDEPTNHLDIQHQLDILSLISKLGITCIVALHDLNLAAMFCDSLAVLQKGKVIASGAPEDVLTEEMIGRVFGVRAHVQKSAVHGRHHIQYVMD
ncbi:MULTISPECIES: ABC transporter ATP-binding protein [Rhizobium]|jgi:iron complex transport system ATP-binding protein|uniref:ABC transporter ATP-binding protein n=1 Tax=Rhizobium TaxID=379 RepID=UPI000BE948F8|nr:MULTISPECIES: ABC transporter ATP-binding protein [Rhizobium]MBB3297123.1 iron complex transport system ATP-binding protein [Rhizobium sp. BK112]MBB3366338.1 iron complex transport system ATP-binding protein [Rhizobium sp. BK077]MBB3741315.1 iron complex transport system ATP-binding protein [Rhizobium sp. BK591]MBB4110977.1 iron complex transport system ATP-binding protein [Rhizobium sp. BK226]MBB4177016.1 iron complex transport system ATP-binding protein [Rhizobium sp. BK109]